MPRTRDIMAATAVLALSSCGLLGNSDSDAAGHAGTATSVAAMAKQQASLEMHPPIAQPGRKPASITRAKSAMTATFSPATRGRPVTLQRKSGRHWSKVTTGHENGSGRVDFTAPTKAKNKVAKYRVVAGKYKGSPRVTSSGVRTDVLGAADFTDEFSGTGLGSDWSDRLQGYEPGSYRKCSKADPSAVEVRGGTALLSVLKDPDRTGSKCSYEGDKYAWRLNGHIGTQGAESFKYGYAAARVKFQPRRGQHASFWLQPESRAASEGSAQDTGAEIDVIEWFGENHPQGGLTSFIYYYPDNGGPGVTAKKVGGYIRKPDRFGGDWASKYHVFSVEWTPSRYVFRIDGKETFRTSQGVSGRPQYLILSLLSSDYELKQLGSDRKLPQTMSVDWVRFWQSDK